MTFFGSIVVFSILILFGLAILLFFILALDSLIRGHDLLTSRRATKALVAMIKQYKPKAANFYDLGCGRGTLALRVKKSLPALEVHGLDNDAVRISFAALKSKILRRKVDFKKQDIFQMDLSGADIIYTYLWYDLMPPLEKKLEKELAKGALVITNTSRFPNWKPGQKVITYPKVSKTPDPETLFVYVKK